MVDATQYLKKSNKELIELFASTWPGEMEIIKIVFEVRNARKMANLTTVIAIMAGLQALTMVLQFLHLG